MGCGGKMYAPCGTRVFIATRYRSVNYELERGECYICYKYSSVHFPDPDACGDFFIFFLLNSCTLL